jgi:hypothetical protein
MKKILIALALTSVSTPVLAQQLPAAVIVTVDRQEMIATSAAAKAAQTELKPKADALNARLSQLRTSLAAAVRKRATVKSLRLPRPITMSRAPAGAHSPSSALKPGTLSATPSAALPRAPFGGFSPSKVKWS